MISFACLLYLKKAIVQAEKDPKFNDLLSKSKYSESQTRPKNRNRPKKHLKNLSEEDKVGLTARIDRV